jgi:adenine-specific DNA-methyltransferase
MKNKKKAGSYYTPKIVSDFLVDYISTKVNGDNLSVLEPSAGDGIFIKSIYENVAFSGRLNSVLAIEKNKKELNKIRRETKTSSLTTVHSDFLDFQMQMKKKFSVILGNPPYIKKGLLLKKQLKLCREIHRNANLTNRNPNNIWSAFLVRSISLLEENGILAFVLPSDFLQVKFANELRDLVLKEFERVEIFTFSLLLFKDSRGQDTLLLVGEKRSNNKGLFYCNIRTLPDLVKRNYKLVENPKLKNYKWAHHHLNSEEIELLDRIKNQLPIVSDYCNTKPGIVTAANEYFIVTDEVVSKYSLQKFIKPIIQKATYVNGSVTFDKNEFKNLEKSCKPTSLIVLDKNFNIRNNTKLKRYLELGEKQGINTRYKTSIREKWYTIPNIGSPPQGFFFRRSNEYPKLIKNSAKVLATDSAYFIEMLSGSNIESMIYSFYNSFSLAFAELNGRYYGGGVLELTPKEFQTLPLPYFSISKKEFELFNRKFKVKKSIAEVCKENDRIILKGYCRNLDDDSIEKLFKVREKLFQYRIKENFF